MNKLIDRYNVESAIVADSTLSDKTKEAVANAKTICETLNNYTPSEQLEIIKVVDKLVARKPLTSISLDKSEFEQSSFKGYLCHKRNNDIMLNESNGRIFNSMAYGHIVRREYNDQLGEEIPCNGGNCDAIFQLDCAEGKDTIKLFFSKGGIVTGDYIDLCYIRSTDKYVTRDPVKIPISIISADDDEMIYFVVDWREPKLHALMEFYDCPIHHKDVKFNIRSYKKLTK